MGEGGTGGADVTAGESRVGFARRWLRDRRGVAWCVRGYQAGSLESRALRKVHCDGRDVGKTSEIEIIAAWASCALPNREMLIATQCENHLFPLMERIARVFERNAAFRENLVEVKRTPSWCLRFSNGFVLWGRIAGPHGMNFQGLHVDWQIVDEAQEMSDAAWEEMFQALNAGGARWVYGVPNGLRNTFYRMTQDASAERYCWPSALNPEFTDEKDAELALLYGGRESPGYIHRVLGQHGSPAYAVFDLNAYLACVDEGQNFFEVSLGAADSFEAPTNVAKGNYYLGCDLGYVRDPSEFVVYRSVPPDLVNVARVSLRGVNYHRQQCIIEELDRAYDFCAIGIDAGNNGSAVAHNLKSIDVDWHERVLAIEFGGVTEVGPFPDGSPDRRPTKLFMTELLQRRMADRTIVFPALADREAQYAGHTYSGGMRGQIVFEKGDDHIIDADRCAVLAHYLDTQEFGACSLPVMVGTFSKERW
ncbi:MAG: hypothetical protein IT366_15650 [Candidatus Hydrogenedentes bacterium]|nr:hypothetical protein [Candidatus Hydrogenedentota bacterium]